MTEPHRPRQYSKNGSLRNNARAVLPLREDIAAPEFPHDPVWLGTDPGKMTPLLARRPVLVYFFDFSQLNSVRAIPYLEEWHRRYESLGLAVIGVQAPRFPFAGDPEAVRVAIDDLGIEFPVLVDSDLVLWTAYGCEGWPSLFLWGKGGILRWFHFGEGDYEGTERAIQGTLGKNESGTDLPGLMEPVRETDRQGIEVIAPSAELLPADGRPWTTEDGGRTFEVEFEAGGVHATATGRGSLGLELDGRSVPDVPIEGPGLYDLIELPGHGKHRLTVNLEGSPEIWSVSFSPATKREP